MSVLHHNSTLSVFMTCQQATGRKHDSSLPTLLYTVWLNVAISGCGITLTTEHESLWVKEKLRMEFSTLSKRSTASASSIYCTQIISKVKSQSFSLQECLILFEVPRSDQCCNWLMHGFYKLMEVFSIHIELNSMWIWRYPVTWPVRLMQGWWLLGQTLCR